MKTAIAAVVSLGASLIIFVQFLSSWWKGGVFVNLDLVFAVLENERLHTVSGIPMIILGLGLTTIPILSVVTTIWSSFLLVVCIKRRATTYMKRWAVVLYILVAWQVIVLALISRT
jgi:hypothetical protein